MNELIKVKAHETLIQTVDARELHEFLESKQQFADWIKNRIEKNKFIENQDFVSFHKIMKQVSGAKHRKEYALSLDMAKHIAMLEQNDKGFQARQYFIECEKQVKAVAKPIEHKVPLQIAADNFKPVFEVMKLIGLDNNAAAISANQAARTVTGVDLLALSGNTHLIAANQKRYLTPTELGQLMTPPVSAQQMNLLLAGAGLQTKEGKDWKPTGNAGSHLYRLFDTGKKHGSGVSVTQLKWSDEVLDVLQDEPLELAA